MCQVRCTDISFKMPRTHAPPTPFPSSPRMLTHLVRLHPCRRNKNALTHQENNLTKTLRALQAESSVCLNTIDNLDNLMSDINHGRWEAVMPQVSRAPRSVFGVCCADVETYDFMRTAYLYRCVDFSSRSSCLMLAP